MSRVGELRRRHSSAKTSSGNNEEKLVPRYLRASTGSCHDFCKYGKHLAVEATKRSCIPRITERTQLRQSLENNIGEVVDLTPGVTHRASFDSEPTRMPLVKHRASTDSNASDTIKVIKTEPDRAIQPDNEVVVNKMKRSSVKVKHSPLLPKSHFPSNFKTRRQAISSGSKMNITPKPISKRVGASSMSSSKKQEPLLKSAFQKENIHPIPTSYLAKTPLKSTFKNAGTSSKLSEKHAISMNLDSRKIASPSMASRKRLADINMHKSLKTVLRVKNQPKPRKVELEEHCIEAEAEEKTLYVIKMENEDQTFQSDQNANQDNELSRCESFSSQEDQEESEYAASEFEEDSCLANNEKVNQESLDILDLKVEENEKPQKDEIVIFVENQIEESSARNIKFKRGKVLRENEADADETDAMIGPEKVVLRHPDVKGKKDEQVLLNNVIEETASKLVEIQRSKVKALVGAFETLISLNEKKTEYIGRH